MMSQNTKTILIGAIVAILAIAAYFFFKSKNDKLTSWRTDPAKVDIVVSENKHDLEIKDTPKPTVAAADSVAVESVEIADEPFEPIEINLKASTVGELAEKMKRETEGLLSNDPFLSPSNIKLNLKNNSFSCIIVKSDVRTNFIKLGLYYGPADSGCESCLTVIEKNPGSIVFASAKGNGLIGQVIGLK